MVKLKRVCNFSFLTEAILGTKWQLCTYILAFPVYALSLHVSVGEILSRYLSLSFKNSFRAVFFTLCAYPLLSIFFFHFDPYLPVFSIFVHRLTQFKQYLTQHCSAGLNFITDV